MTQSLPDPTYQPEFYTGVTPKRLFAWIIDLVLIFGLCLVILPFTAFTALFFFPFFFFVIGFAYRVVMISNGSATLGMHMMAIELRDAEGAKLGLSGAFLHTLGYTISTASLLIQVASAVLMLSSEKGQGLTDMVLGTAMINKQA